MKISCISINTNILLGKEQDKIIEFLSKKLLELGVTFNKIVVSQSSPEQIKNAISFANENVVIIIGDKSSVRNYQIKSSLSRLFGLSLSQNQTAIASVENFYKKNNIPPQLESQNEHYIPSSAKVLASSVSAELGFMLTTDKTYIFLPNNIYAVKEIFNNFLIEEFTKKVKTEYDNITIKTFGISEKDILFLLQNLLNNKYKIFITTYPVNLDVAINIRFDKKIDNVILQSFMSEVYSKLKKYIYANEDNSIFQTALDLLKLTKKRLILGESITQGNLVNSFLNTSKEASEYLTKATIYPNADALVKYGNISKEIVNRHGFSSVETAYEMAVNLLDKNSKDFVVCTCGEWVGDQLHTTQLTCYIAVGDEDGIHVYKNTYSGEFSAVIDNISKSSIFYLIKKIKQKDLYSGQTTV